MKTTGFKISILIVTIALSIVACKKDMEIEHKTPVVKDDKVEATATTAQFDWTVDYPGALRSVVKLSLNEDMSDATSFGTDSISNQKVFTATAKGLTVGSKYYYCYETWNPLVDYTSEVKSFTTSDPSVPTVTTYINSVSNNSATAGGRVVDNGNAEVTEVGFCWGTSHNPTIDGSHSHQSDFLYLNNFSLKINDLNEGTTYYLRFYAINRKGIGYSEEVSFTTDCFINAKALPDGYGTVSGDGIFHVGQTCTLTAVSSEFSNFINWTKDDAIVSTDSIFSFTVTEPALYVANFQFYNCTITVNANPTEGGTVSGGDSYISGQQCTVTATANEGFCFAGWIEDGIKVSVDFDYSFTVTRDRVLEAFFVPIPIGVIDGLFTINEADDQVFFSQGNLQYIGSNNTWKFADNQWDIIGESQGNNEQGTTRDLFGWGTSGYNHGANCYQPWSTSQNDDDYWVYGNYTYNLYDQTGKADWGYNAISNGGNQENSGWRTLTKDEWEYLFNTRTTASGIRYAKACVNGVNGVILLPDSWLFDYYTLYSTDIEDTDYTTNIIDVIDWNMFLEPYGCVFLPAAGYRMGIELYDVGSHGVYHTSSNYNYDFLNIFYIWQYSFAFNDSFLLCGDGGRHTGQSVRLVRDAR